VAFIADVAKQRAHETEEQAAETNCLEYHTALNKLTTPLTRWNRILRKILTEKIRIISNYLLFVYYTPEDGRLWPKHVVLVLNCKYFNDCCIIDGLWIHGRLIKDAQQDAEMQTP
jgi:hypothetical protein